MCGICGFNWMDGPLLEQMKALLVHRGPDDQGSYLAEGISLGHRRLSIVDLSEHGRQPLANEDGSVWIAFNGEIYNHGELRARLESAGHVFRSRTDTGSSASCKRRSKRAGSLTSAGASGPDPAVGIACTMLLLIVSVSTEPAPRVLTGPRMQRSIVRLVTVPSIHKRVGASGLPSAALANSDAGGEPEPVAPAAPPGSSVQQLSVTLSKLQGADERATFEGSGSDHAGSFDLIRVAQPTSAPTKH